MSQDTSLDGRFADLHVAIDVKTIKGPPPTNYRSWRWQMKTFAATDTLASVLRELRAEYNGIETRKMDLKRTISMLEERLDGGMGLPRDDQAGSERGPYTGMNLKPAITLVLDNASRPVTNRGVLALLQEGGWHSESANPGGLVNRALRDMRAQGRIVRTDRGFYTTRTRE